MSLYEIKFRKINAKADEKGILMTHSSGDSLDEVLEEFKEKYPKTQILYKLCSKLAEKEYE